MFLGILNHYSYLLPWSGVHRRALASSSQELLGQLLHNLVSRICRVRRQGIVNFMIPTARGGNLGTKNVKPLYFLESLLITRKKILDTL